MNLGIGDASSLRLAKRLRYGNDIAAQGSTGFLRPTISASSEVGRQFLEEYRNTIECRPEHFIRVNSQPAVISDVLGIFLIEEDQKANLYRLRYSRYGGDRPGV